MWKHVSTVAAHDWLNGSPEYIDSRRDALQAAWQAFKKEIPTTRHALEDEFRMMLGVEKSRLPGTAT
jgi:hypothetical protein